jgi:hypothetical protein
MTANPPWQSFVTCVDLSDKLCRVASCRAALPSRRTAYCSDRHAREFERNHLWFVARRAARRRARWACERCGFKPSEIRKDPVARQQYSRYELRLEVNHIQPLVGSYRLVSCLNHQTNLEVLCHRCHAAVTRGQVAREASDPESGSLKDRVHRR